MFIFYLCLPFVTTACFLTDELILSLIKPEHRPCALHVSHWCHLLSDSHLQ